MLQLTLIPASGLAGLLCLQGGSVVLGTSRACWHAPGDVQGAGSLGSWSASAGLGGPVPGLDSRRRSSCCWLCKSRTWEEPGESYLAAPESPKGRGAWLEAAWKRRMGHLYLTALPWGLPRLRDTVR